MSLAKIFLFYLLVPCFAYGEVDLVRGSFSIDFEDGNLKGSKLTRSYDSKMKGEGIFGFGWRSSIDNNFEKRKIKWGENKKIKSIVYDGGEIKYSYDDKFNLVKVEKGNGKSFKYEYDLNHNLISSTFEDNSSIEVKYDDKSLVREFKDQSGNVTTYSYDRDKNSPQTHFFTVIKQLKPYLKEFRYEYELKKKRMAIIILIML